ncbi:hypothetical protein LL06_20885 [Hoeflea sp. BAL378]|uniref:hypothetical protein n=1 Tax=Hoeflea sp. BAL378 TaxID=1547437 RepID=UPI0005146958|nr:hypothetical protein [Hoeflea sp. BAL378]KGF67682.1 hypothetical protein LL06_20885 [Hoeflea sp. BAL378]
MAIRITTIRGLHVDIVVEEFDDRDAAGHLNAYVAIIYKQAKNSSSKTLIGRSRLPDAASEIRREIKSGGLQAFRRLAHV